MPGGPLAGNLSFFCSLSRRVFCEDLYHSNPVKNGSKGERGGCWELKDTEGWGVGGGAGWKEGITRL